MIKALLTLGAVLILSCGVVVADDSPSAPKSYAAKKAVERHGYAVKKAEQEYQRSLAAAKRELIAELERAKAQAMQAKQLDEANAIQAAIDTAKADLDRITGKAEVQTFKIQAGGEWHDTIEVNTGDQIAIETKGQWVADPSRPREFTFRAEGEREGKWFGVFGRVGDSSSFPLPAGQFVPVESSGRLQLKLGGGNVERDDVGQVVVSIHRRR